MEGNFARSPVADSNPVLPSGCLIFIPPIIPVFGYLLNRGNKYLKIRRKLPKTVNMQYLGSVRLDGSKRITLIKEVAEILELGPQDHVMFYIDNGEVTLRRVLPESEQVGIRYNNDSFWEWARKRQIEIDMMDPGLAEVAQADLDDKKESVKELEEEMQKLGSDGGLV